MDWVGKSDTNSNPYLDGGNRLWIELENVTKMPLFSSCTRAAEHTLKACSDAYVSVGIYRILLMFLKKKEKKNLQFGFKFIKKWKVTLITQSNE
jgi:hypothetical protein